MSGRVLWITDRYPPAKGGMAASCARQVAAMRRLGIPLDLVILGAPFVATPATEGRDNGLDIVIPPDADASLVANLAWSIVQEHHLQRPYSVICGFGASLGGFHAVTYAAWLGIPSAVLVRGNDFDRDWFWPQRGGMLREALSRADAIGAVTREKVDRIRALYPGKRVEWTPNGIDIARWQLLAGDRKRRDEIRGLLHAGDGARVVGLFGELKAKKRIPFWLEAIRYRGLLSKIRLLVVGTLDAPTAAILDDPAIAPRSLRLPFCSPDELPAFYAAADFVALPSLFEGMPNVLLEAMACGVVPIASTAGAMPEIIRDGDNGFLFPAGSRDAAGHASARALALSDEHLESFSARARNTIRDDFSPQREIDALRALLGV